MGPETPGRLSGAESGTRLVDAVNGLLTSLQYCMME